MARTLTSIPPSEVRGSEISEPDCLGEAIDAFAVAFDAATAVRGSERSEPDCSGVGIDGHHLGIDGNHLGIDGSASGIRL